MTASRLRTRRATTRIAAGLGLAAAAVLLGSTAASAHVRVEGDGATQGGYGVLTFRVPTESATASTTSLTITLPSDTPIASVSTEPIPGWTAKVTTKELDKPIETDDGQLSSYVSKVRWTADSDATAIHPGEFQRFSISAGPLPEVDRLVLPALQKYSDGSEVRWNEQASGSAEPEYPAPVLELAASTGDDHGHGTSDPSADPVEAENAASTTQAADGTGLAVGVGGVAIAVVALVVAVIALLRGPKRAGA
jgi:periplasmic copper chaperone A